MTETAERDASRPLAGRVILVTSDRRSAELATALQRRGAEVRHAAVMSIIEHVADEVLVGQTRELLDDPPDIVVATTGIGFRGWLEAADAAGIGSQLRDTLGRAQLIARGAKGHGAIRAAGLPVAWIAESETSAEVLDHLRAEGVNGRHIVVQHHGAGADDLDTELAAAGARVTSLVVYRWGPPPDPEAVAESVRATARGEVHAVMFTSAPGAQTWLEVAEAQGALEAVRSRASAGELVMVAVGPVTAVPLEQAGITPLVPGRSRLGAMVKAIADHRWPG